MRVCTCIYTRKKPDSHKHSSHSFLSAFDRNEFDTILSHTSEEKTKRTRKKRKPYSHIPLNRIEKNKKKIKNKRQNKWDEISTSSCQQYTKRILLENTSEGVWSHKVSICFSFLSTWGSARLWRNFVSFLSFSFLYIGLYILGLFYVCSCPLICYLFDLVYTFRSDRSYYNKHKK